MFFAKDAWVAELNRRGGRRQPSFFCIDAWAETALIADPETVPGLLRFDIRGRRSGAASTAQAALTERPHIEITEPPSRERYDAAFETVQAAILRGESWLANLTASTRVEASHSIETIYESAAAPYKLWVSGELLAGAPPELRTGPEGFALFSPEAFVRIDDGVIATFPMKGTALASDGGGEDAVRAAGARLLADPKEEAEHTTVVDLLRNDLGRVASAIQVPRFRYLDRVTVEGGTLLQTSSRIQGKLDQNWQASLGDILAQLLPAGSVTGAPKHRTVEIVRDAEERLLGHRRAWYAGVFGLFYGEGLDSAVNIRYVESVPGPDGVYFTVFKSGGGVTYASTPDSEYRELIEKVRIPLNNAR